MTEIAGREALIGGVGLVVAMTGAGLAVVGRASLASVGLALVQVALLFGVAAYFAGKRANLDDAFQAGYRSGFHRGQRVKPKVVRFPSGRSAVQLTEAVPRN